MIRKYEHKFSYSVQKSWKVYRLRVHRAWFCVEKNSTDFFLNVTDNTYTNDSLSFSLLCMYVSVQLYTYNHCHKNRVEIDFCHTRFRIHRRRLIHQNVHIQIAYTYAFLCRSFCGIRKVWNRGWNRNPINGSAPSCAHFSEIIFIWKFFCGFLLWATCTFKIQKNNHAHTIRMTQYTLYMYNRNSRTKIN